MARFILDVATQYDDKGKITTDIKKLKRKLYIKK